jgi:DNA-binding MarR family transcriptional regulator
MTKTLPASQLRILRCLRRAEGSVPLGRLEAELGLPHPRVAADCQVLAEQGYLESREETDTEYSLGPNGWAPLPERTVARALAQAGGELDMSQVAQASSLAPKDVGAAMGPLLRRKWATKDGRRLVLTDEGKAAVSPGVPTRWGEDERLLIELRRQKKEHGVTRVKRQHLGDLAIDLAVAEGLLKGRDEFVGWKVKARRLVSLSPAGRDLLQEVSEVRPHLRSTFSPKIS